jgi:hypothetical protein
MAMRRLYHIETESAMLRRIRQRSQSISMGGGKTTMLVHLGALLTVADPQKEGKQGNHPLTRGAVADSSDCVRADLQPSRGCFCSRCGSSST